MNKNIIRRILQVLITFILEGGLLLISAWTLQWLCAWIFLGVCILILTINFIVLPTELIEERGKKKENVKQWDKIVSSLTVIPIIGLFIVAGFDYRLQWTNDFPFAFNLIGLVVFFLGSMLFTWAMVSNKYFSTSVRLQTDRGHQVATAGPYQYVRHPGYVGFIVYTLATPIALGSLWALLCSAVVAILFIIRTALEDKTLKAELSGYLEYAEKVKYRLLPGIW